MKSDVLISLESEVLLLDGAMGTKLQQEDLETDTAPEVWNLKRPEIIKQIHQDYLAAGSQIIQTNTFGANRIKLGEYGLAQEVEEINRAAVRIAKEVKKDNYIAGSVGPFGKFLAPIGDVTFEEAIDIFKEQIAILVDSGVDLISLETMSSLQELRAAVIAAKEVSDNVPVMAQMTFDENLRTLSGTTPKIAAVVLDALGADIIGANCSLGPQGLLDVLKELNQVTDKPLIVQPNAGLPKIIDGETVYQKSPEEMTTYIKKFVAEGANIIGGCCGTTEDHIAAFAQGLQGLTPSKSKLTRNFRLASRSQLMELSDQSESLIIGERINPSGKERLAEELKNNSFKVVQQEINSQIKTGAKVLDINVGGAGIDEVEMMKNVVQKVQNTSRVPVCIDTTDVESLEAGLEAFTGKALINSVTGEEESLNRVLPLAKKYGAALVCLTLDEDGIPDTAEGRLEIARKIKNKAISYGIPPEDLLIDTLVLTASTKQAEVVETLNAIKLVKEELGLKTVLGVSNVSYGLPQKPLLNRTFLAMALGYGLDAYIVDPLDEALQKTILAGDVLINRDQNAAKYIDALGQQKVTQDRKVNDKEEDKDVEKTDLSDKKQNQNDKSLELVKEAVLKGELEEIISILKNALEEYSSDELMNKALIPGIKEVGNKYETGEYFLPQLMASAESMQKGFKYLKDELGSDIKTSSAGKVLLATVKGDVHDIGKNIVKVVVENHGYEVLDLGKDVSNEQIIEAVKQEKVDVVGLSALMTTTMVEMEEVVKRLKAENLDVKVILGGAVITQDYADKIGADAYAINAINAVREIKRLI
ncbi:homocysteine S-methyltransferase family protein [Selenihalanaerobacter shriftii]|uniref:Methionine synthase n=1 Tax=Selenihalanaerobacter shriftii TaxID=142842 RepID=A0A1T4LGK7_9FIRM|nr:homocysteine S-methyltransferase family protein [Selenihalanaerobacter shriftii]SJZ53902.1 5-methyltetrahydrofolate--homocysteine methyltransferase [Selenihalanaerobacter shriftii]